MLTGHVVHFRAHERPEAVLLAYVEGLVRFDQAVPVIVFALHDQMCPLADPEHLARVQVVLVHGDGLYLPARVFQHGFLAEEGVRVLVHGAAAHVVVGEVRAHEILVARGPADTPRLADAWYIQPLVVFAAGVFVVPGQIGRAAHVGGLLKDHDRFPVRSVILGKALYRAHALAAASVDEGHGDGGGAVFSVGAVVHQGHDLPARELLSRKGRRVEQQQEAKPQHPESGFHFRISQPLRAMSRSSSPMGVATVRECTDIKPAPSMLRAISP